MHASSGSDFVRKLEVRHLRLLVAVANRGSIRATAATLGLAQPNVSQQLQRIERQFAAPIFHRGTGGVTPTTYGEEILACASDILERIESIGTVRPESVLRHRYHELDISRMGIEFPADVRADWESAEVTPEDGVSDVLRGRADIFVGAHWPHTPWPDYSGLTAVNLFSSTLRVMVSDDHPLVADHPSVVSLDILSNERWIGRESLLTTILECEFFGLRPDVREFDCNGHRDALVRDGAVCFVDAHDPVPAGTRLVRYVGASPIHHLMHYHHGRTAADEANAIVRSVRAVVGTGGSTSDLIAAE